MITFTRIRAVGKGKKIALEIVYYKLLIMILIVIVIVIVL